MKIWIDAASEPQVDIFGASLIERHLRALRHQKIDASEIIIDYGARANLPDETTWKLLRSAAPDAQRVIYRHTPGSTGERLHSAMQLAGDEPFLVTTARTLVDARLYGFLSKKSENLRVVNGAAVLARIEDRAAIDLTAPDLASATARGVPLLAQEDFPAFIGKLRRSLPYYLFEISDAESRDKVERFLFWSNYKGSTDFFTKYVYPPLVWQLVPPLARARIHPNWVTIVSILLTFAAVPLFASGYFILGFLCAYAMSVLDSVDGKLARLTFTDSPLGNILDHGLDLIHPPFWYLAWALGLSHGDTDSAVFSAALAMLGLYIIDRLILKIYPTRFGKGLHTHAPIDAAMRTFISRRNINLPFFTVCYFLGWGIPAIYCIVVWQALTCLYHGGRTGWILWTEKKAAHPAP